MKKIFRKLFAKFFTKETELKKALADCIDLYVNEHKYLTGSAYDNQIMIREKIASFKKLLK